MEPDTMDTETADRARFCAALHELAAFLSAHPELPLPSSAQVGPYVCGDDDEERAEVDRIAGILGVEPVMSAAGSYYRAERRFGEAESTGGITYTAVAITAARMAQYEAHMAQFEPVSSDDGVVTP